MKKICNNLPRVIFLCLLTGLLNGVFRNSADAQYHKQSGSLSTCTDSSLKKEWGRWNHVREFTTSLGEKRQSFSPSTSSSDSTLVEVGSWLWGQCYGADIYSDRVAFIGNGYCVHTLDISDIDSPHIIGEYVSSSWVMDLTVRDSLVYVLLNRSLLILDAHEPRSLNKLSEIRVTTIATQQLFLGPSCAYIVTFDGIQIVDIHDPASPSLRGYLNTGEYASGFALSGAKLFVNYALCYDCFGFDIYDVSDPLHPYYDTMYTTGIYSNAFATIDTVLFTVGFTPTGNDSLPIPPMVLQSYNIRDARHPISISSDTLNIGANLDLTVSLDRDRKILYAMTESTSVYAIDVSDPSKMMIRSIVTHLPHNPEPSKSISARGNRAITSVYNGAWVIDASRLDTLKDGMIFYTADLSSDIALDSSYVFIATGSSGMSVLDISNPQHPERVNVSPPPGGESVVSVSLDDHYLFLTSGGYQYEDDSLIVLDVSDVHNLRRVAALGLPPGGHWVRTSSGRAYVAESDSNVIMYDIAHPENPIEIGRYRVPQNKNFYSSQLAVQDSQMFLLDRLNGISIVDVANPSEPKELGHIPGDAVGFICEDTLLYTVMLSESSNFSVYSIAHPESCKLLSSLHVMLPALSTVRIAVSSGYVYFEGVTLDVSDPHSPKVVNYFPLVGSHAWLTASQGPFVYLYDNAGWHIVQNNLITSVSDAPLAVPSELHLDQNYPNPFNSNSIIQFSIPKELRIRMEIFDITGRHVSTLLDEIKPPGTHLLSWDAASLPSGTYFFRLEMEGSFITRKAVIMK